MSRLQKILTKTLATTLLLIAPTFAAAQAPPGTDIFLAPILPGNEAPTLGPIQNITHRQGYDNQPSFLPNGKGLVYTSIREDQADIYLYDLAKKESSAVTTTPESEYSPTPIPGDAQGISVVRVEADQRQRLWRFPLAGGEPSLLLPDIEPVGYHAWGSDNQLALFVLGEPNVLQRAAMGEGKGTVVAKNIGRALHKIPHKNAFSFIHKEHGEDGRWWVKKLTMDSTKIEPLIEAFPQREDLAWSADGKLWMADGSKIYRWCPVCGGGWDLIADLAEQGLKGKEITRLAVHPKSDLLAFVANRQESGESTD